jgi:hypothetical protein
VKREISSGQHVVVKPSLIGRLEVHSDISSAPDIMVIMPLLGRQSLVCDNGVNFVEVRLELRQTRLKIVRPVVFATKVINSVNVSIYRPLCTGNTLLPVA